MGKQSDLAQKLTGELAARMRDLRKRSGKSLRELERPTHCSDSSLSRYLAGRALPPWQVVEALSDEGRGDSAALRELWTRAWQARAEARIGEQSRQETVPVGRAARRVPVRWLVALVAVAGLVGVLARRRLAGA
jgi:transcriptional regulator with XRE-family HTH domain